MTGWIGGLTDVGAGILAVILPVIVITKLLKK
jgi:hypothetical protein